MNGIRGGVTSVAFPVAFLSCMATLGTLGTLGGCQRAYLQTYPTYLKEDFGSKSSPFSLSQQLDGLLQNRAAKLHVGMVVLRASDGKVLYTRQPQKTFIPASTVKLFTAAAALHGLGPTYRYPTEVWKSDDPGRQTLYLKGYGDPSLTKSSFKKLAHDLKVQNITQVGDVVVDASYFDDVSWPPGWMWDDLPEGYGASIHGLNIKDNRLTVTVQPALHPQELAFLQVQPSQDWLHWVHKVVTVEEGTPASFSISTDGPPHSRGLSAGQTLTLEGRIPVNGPTLVRTFAIEDPVWLAGTVFQEQLREEGIRVTGQVRKGTIPENALLRAQHVSMPVDLLLSSFIKASNNHGMECILKTMGAFASLGPGTWPDGLTAVRNFLQKNVGIDTTRLSLQDGSGLSRYDLVTPMSMAQLLLFMHRNFPTGLEFMSALPRGGLDGTLDKRFKKLLPPAYVRAKTGSLSGISNLAGYVHTYRQETLIFVIFMNLFTDTLAPYLQLQEDMVEVLARSSER